MNGIHDMGGMHGFGPIAYEEDEPVFHHEWEGRVYAIRTHTPVRVPGGGRYVIERLDPALYLASSYYERWLHAAIQGLIEAEAITQAEFEEHLAYFRENPQDKPPRREDPEAVERVVAKMNAPYSHRKAVDVRPSFGIEDLVRTKNMHPVGHTRLPQYVRGKQAIVVKYYGVQDFDDTLPPGVEREPQPLYCVRFEGQELWGEFAEPNSAIYMDMWESYLEFV